MSEPKNRIFELRKGRDYTQDQLAELLGVKPSTIAMWESGERTPKREAVEAICDLFNVSVDYLYGRTDVKRPVLYDEYGDKFLSLSSDEESLLRAYRELSREGKDKLLERCAELKELGYKKGSQDFRSDAV